MDAELFLSRSAELVDRFLDSVLPAEGSYPPVLAAAVRYSALDGGKRFRPALAFGAAECIGGDREQALPVAAALEMIHAYSLVHDDLPAMDDDTWRRGKLTNHRKFGEATAILAGDALLTQSFQVLSEAGNIPPPQRVKIIAEIAAACGAAGLIGGQVVDLESTGREVDMPTLEYIHIHKTGALIQASVRAGALSVGGRGDSLEKLSFFGRRIGLGFQIIDDILDIEGKPEETGKFAGRDIRHRKATYPALIGIEASRQRAMELIEEGCGALADFGPEADPLRSLALFIESRCR